MSAEREFVPTRESIAKYVKQNLQKVRKLSGMMGTMHHKGDQEIIREDDYEGHHVVVRTRYNITIDGHHVTGHIMLTNMGQVQYHGLPNYSFDSAVELARALIDNFPEDFEKRERESGSKDRARASGGSPGSMDSTKMSGKGIAKLPRAVRKRSARKSMRGGVKNKP
jgi:hypothetical protein